MKHKPLDLDFQYPTYDVCLDRAVQVDKLACCDIDPALFGEYADITHFALETIIAAKRGGASINGTVHVTQEFDQRAPVRLGETLTLCGEITDFTPVAKGEMVTSRFQMSRANGEVPLVLERTSLRVDPTRAKTVRPSESARTGSQEGDLVLVATHQLVPDKVARYSAEGDNFIHSDPEVARQYGFKAPIAAGLMAVRYMMAHLWRRGPIDSLRMSISFRRPMFWDDELGLHRAMNDEHRLVIVRGEDGKVANEAQVHAVSYLA